MLTHSKDGSCPNWTRRPKVDGGEDEFELIPRKDVLKTIGQDGIWLVYFYAETYCQADCDAIAAFASENPDLQVIEIRVDEGSDWTRYSPSIKTTPTLVVYRGGMPTNTAPLTAPMQLARQEGYVPGTSSFTTEFLKAFTTEPVCGT